MDILSDYDTLQPDLLFVLNEHREVFRDWVRGAPTWSLKSSLQPPARSPAARSWKLTRVRASRNTGSRNPRRALSKPTGRRRKAISSQDLLARRKSFCHPCCRASSFGPTACLSP